MKIENQHVQKLYTQGQIKAALEYLNEQEGNYPKERDLNSFFNFHILKGSIFEGSPARAAPC